AITLAPTRAPIPPQRDPRLAASPGTALQQLCGCGAPLPPSRSVNDESIKHLSQRSNGRATPTRRRWAALSNRQDRCGWGEVHVACSTARADSQYVGSVTICWDVLLFPRDPELLHSRFERGGLHAEVLCGSPLTADAPPRQLEHGPDMLTFDLLERPGSPRTAPAAGRHWPPAQVELGTRTEDRRPLDHVFKLANIARPGIGLEHLHDCR